MAYRNAEEDKSDKEAFEQRATAPEMSDRDSVCADRHMDALLDHVTKGAGFRTAQG